MATQLEPQPLDSDFPAPEDEYTDEDESCKSSDAGDDWDPEDVEEQPHPSHIMDKYANW